MLKATAIAAFAAAMLASPLASAQVLDLGRGGPRLDLRSDSQRHHDRMERRMMRDRAERRMMHREHGYDGHGRRGDRYGRSRSHHHH